MNQRVAVLALAFVALASSLARATFDVTLHSGFDLNWYFHIDPTDPAEKYESLHYVLVGYYRDYDGDGLPDHLVVLEDPDTDDWRIFAINTTPTGTEKTYTSDRTAGRDFTAQPGSFMIDSVDPLYFPYQPGADSPDMVLAGTNRAAGSDEYTQFVFQRLDKTNTAFPTDDTWSVDVVSTDSPTIHWPQASFNGDNYPDFLVYNQTPNASQQFVVTCYDGYNGSQIWSRQLGLDPEQAVLPVPGLILAQLSVFSLSEDLAKGTSGDFDGNGKPEVFLFYWFINDTFTSMATNINLLDSNGNFLSPYSSTWTRICEVAYPSAPPVPHVLADYDKDGYVDLLVHNIMAMSTPPPPVFEGYSLKKRQSLFQSVASDFGSSLDDLTNMQAFSQWSYANSAPADADGDGWTDLNVFRPRAIPPDMPLRVGLFHAYAGGGSQKGQRMCLDQFDTFNMAHWDANDFDGNDLTDYVLVNLPSEPGNPTVWHIGNAAITPSAVTVVKEFDYSRPASVAWNPATDDFEACSVGFWRLGDVDGDAQRDTAASLMCAIDHGGDGSTDVGYGFVFVYDNTPGTSAPDITAEAVLKAENEDWVPASDMTPAFVVGPDSAVDQNRDGYVNDKVMHGAQAFVAVSFQYQTAPSDAARWQLYR
ncbi:hypothetical protein AMJ85_06480 [candidate division BRC1 bacterium SM23_51]|nr:MAG: hypothetical protein AMJ85_06480 [candidate division BRC1 bacterium SM23_51]